MPKPGQETIESVLNSADLAVPVDRIVPSPAALDPLADLRREMSEIRAEVLRHRDSGQGREPAVADLGGFTELAAESVLIEPFATKAVSYPGDWQLGPILEATGLQPRHVLRVVERLCQDYGEAAPEALGEQLALASKVLKGEWLVPPALSPSGTPETHVLIGPAGSGKTTALCKWLAQLVLVEGRSTAVFRLDGETANTGEFLSVHSEVLGVPVQRSLTPDWRSAAEMVFIDLPGISHTDRSSMNKLLEQLKEMRPAQVHLVLNAAYESALLMAQIRGFAPLQPDDWMATHLDEEPRWGKLWNGIMGTNCPLSWMGIGQNIPGMFHRADPVRVLNRQFNR
jgi:flagellar biosynthesis protein FlhF